MKQASIKNSNDLLFTILVIFCVLSALTSLVSFICYVKARMAEREDAEKFYKSLHFNSLLLFVVLGVIILVILSNRLEKPTL